MFAEVAFFQTICSVRESCGIVSVGNLRSTTAVAESVAREMGQNFGMMEDTTNCTCEHEHCIMAKELHDTTHLRWSSCSIKQLKSTFHRGMDICLRFGLLVNVENIEFWLT